MQQPRKWWIGLPVLAGILYFASDSLTRRIEVDLSGRGALQLGEFKGAIEDASVTATGRDLVLGGFALSPEGREQALAAAGRIEGARRVLDQTRPLEAARPFVLNMRRDGARVTLEGNVPPGGDREKLQAELRRLGLEVADRAAYAKGAPPVFGELALFAAQRLAYLDPGAAKLTDDALELKGDARPKVDFQKLLAAAKAPPAGARIARLDLAPPSVSPFKFSAKFGAGVLTLAGNTPPDAFNDIRALASKLAPGVAVADGLAPAGGAPKDFGQAIAAGFDALGRLNDGTLTISDRLVTLQGDAPPGAGPEIGEGLARALPQGFGLSLQLTARGAEAR